MPCKQASHCHRKPYHYSYSLLDAYLLLPLQLLKHLQLQNRQNKKRKKRSYNVCISTCVCPTLPVFPLSPCMGPKSRRTEKNLKISKTHFIIQGIPNACKNVLFGTKVVNDARDFRLVAEKEDHDDPFSLSSSE